MQMHQQSVINLLLVALLEPANGTASDGFDWMRLVIGVFLTASAVLCLDTHFSENTSLLVITALLGLLLTASWIVIAGVLAARREIHDIQSSYSD